MAQRLGTTKSTLQDQSSLAMLHTCARYQSDAERQKVRTMILLEHDNNVTYKKVYRQPQIPGQLHYTLHSHES